MNPATEPHLDEDTCLNLVHGLLPAVEVERVLGHVRRCERCEAFLKARVAQREKARALVGELLQGLPLVRAIGEPRGSGSTGSGGGRLGRLRLKRLMLPSFLLSAAAAAAILLVTWVSHRAEPGPELPWLATPRFYDARSNTDVHGERVLQQGIEAYVNRDPSRAVELLGNARLEGSLDAMRRIYLANALLHAGRAEEVPAALRDLNFELVPEPFGSEGQWALMVSHRAGGRRAEADAILSELARSPGPVGDRARAYAARLR